jgi:four helix bundle protein
MRDFRDLEVWHFAHRLALKCYALVKKLPPDEQYGLVSQIRRAASSVPTNVAEGCGTATQAEFARFLQIAMRSASELEYLLLLARDLGYLPDQDFDDASPEVVRVKKMLAALLSRINPTLRMPRPSGRQADKPTSRPADVG